MTIIISGSPNFPFLPLQFSYFKFFFQCDGWNDKDVDYSEEQDIHQSSNYSMSARVMMIRIYIHI